MTDDVSAGYQCTPRGVSWAWVPDENCNGAANASFRNRVVGQNCTVARMLVTWLVVVVILESQDGGMAANTTVSVLQQWRPGTCPDGLFWKRSLLDAAEVFKTAEQEVLIDYCVSIVRSTE